MSFKSNFKLHACLTALQMKSAYTNNEINSGKNLYVFFSCRWGATHRKIYDFYICPPNIILGTICEDEFSAYISSHENSSKPQQVT